MPASTSAKYIDSPGILNCFIYFLSIFSNKITYIHSVYIVFLHNTTEYRVRMKSQNNDTLITWTNWIQVRDLDTLITVIFI